MELIKPDIGLIFWMSLSFLIVLFLLKKYAWEPILNALREREDSIEDALEEAKKARQEIQYLKAKNEDLLKEARQERDQILKEGRDLKNKIIAEARISAKEEADKVLQSAREAIVTEKKAAIAELKNQVAGLSLDIAEKILKKELVEFKKQKNLINNLIEEIEFN